jgi:hypothetical protein
MMVLLGNLALLIKDEHSQAIAGADQKSAIRRSAWPTVFNIEGYHRQSGWFTISSTKVLMTYGNYWSIVGLGQPNRGEVSMRFFFQVYIETLTLPFLSVWQLIYSLTLLLALPSYNQEAKSEAPAHLVVIMCPSDAHHYVVVGILSLSFLKEIERSSHRCLWRSGKRP